MEPFKLIVSSSRLEITKLVSFITVIIILFVIFQLAKISWLVVEPAPLSSSSWQLPTRASPNNAEFSEIDYSSYSWFGQLDATAKPQVAKPRAVTKAPQTKLKLILTGLVASDIPENSMAIVEYKGKQATYGIDEKISGTRAIIDQIYHDRLILRNSGVYETLMLDGFDYQTQSKASRASAGAKSSQTLSEKIKQSRAEILKDPGKIVNYISITPVRKKNKITGYRLNPGRDPSLFQASGLQHNDLAISINGYDLTDFSESMKVMNELKTMTDISLVVLRQGQLIDIQFGLSQ